MQSSVLYIVEMAPPSMRGGMGIMFQLVQCLGILIAYVYYPPSPFYATSASFLDPVPSKSEIVLIVLAALLRLLAAQLSVYETNCSKSLQSR